MFGVKEFRVWCFGLRVWGSSFRVVCSRFKCPGGLGVRAF